MILDFFRATGTLIADLLRPADNNFITPKARWLYALTLPFTAIAVVAVAWEHASAETGRPPQPAEGEKKILALVARKGPGTSREAISEATGYKRSSRDTYLQRLSARRLIVTTREGVTASEELFG